MNREFDVLSELHAGGADVPQPFFATDRAILMAYAGGEAAAPQLQHAPLERAAAAPLLDRLLANIETFLDHHLVHGDLSPFNVLVGDDGQPLIIDFPQAVDARKNPGARRLLERDTGNLCRFFARHGVECDPRVFCDHLWARYQLGEVGTYAGLG